VLAPSGRSLDPLNRQTTSALWVLELATSNRRRLATGDAVHRSPTDSASHTEVFGDTRTVATPFFWTVDGTRDNRIITFQHDTAEGTSG
jgi:hypothetical protein